MINRPIINKAPHIPELYVQPYERYLPSAFDESLSILQKVNKMIKQLSLIGEISNDLVTQWNGLIDWILKSGLNEIISDEIDKRIADGTFDELIYKIVGSLPDLETNDKTSLVHAINEVYQASKTNTDHIGVMDELKTTAKQSIVDAINEIKLTNDLNNEATITIGESTGDGIISGFHVRQQNVLAMAVEVGNNLEPNIVHMPNGVRYVIESVPVAIDDAEVSLNRVDSIYVNTDGVITYLKGVASLNPLPSILPDNSVLLAHINVLANDTTINNSDIVDKRQMKSLRNLATENKTNFTQAINELVVMLVDLSNNKIGDITKLLTDNKSSVVNAINEIKTFLDNSLFDVNGLIELTNEKIGNIETLPTTDKTTIVNAITEIYNNTELSFTEINDRLDLFITQINTDLETTETGLNNKIGNLPLLETVDKTNLVVAINEVLQFMRTANDEILDNVIGDLTLLNTNDKTTIVASINDLFSMINTSVDESITEIESSITSIQNTIGSLTNLTTTNKTDLVSAINELNENVESLQIEMDSQNLRMSGIALNVKELGAKGDGLTDDTQAFKNAIAESKYIFIPAGRYRITEPLLIENSFHLFGTGNEITVLLKDFNDGHLFHIRNVKSAWKMTDFKIENPRAQISGGAIHINGSSNGEMLNVSINGGYDGIEVNDAQNNSFDHITIWGFRHYGLFFSRQNNDHFMTKMFINGELDNNPQNAGTGTGIRMTNKAEALMFSQVEVIQCVHAMSTDSEINQSTKRPGFSRFDSCFFDSSTEGVSLNKCADMQFVNCWFSNRPGNGIIVTDCKDITFTNTSFINGNQHGCLVQPSSKRVKFIGCTFGNNSEGGVGTYHGLVIASNTTDFIITNCSFINDLDFGGTQGWGVLIDTGASDRYVVTNNLFQGNIHGKVLDGGTGENKIVENNF